LAEPCAPAAALALPLLSALSGQTALALLTSQPIVIKWPNDLLIVAGQQGYEPGTAAANSSGLATAADYPATRAKLAGIIVTARGHRVVIGIGVNILRPQPQPQTQPPHQAGQEATADRPFAYLADYPNNLPISREAAAAALIAQLEQALAQWRAHGYRFTPFRQAYESRLDQLGQDVDVYDSHGNLLAAGRVLGVDEHGYLRLQTNSGEKQIAAGEVTLRQNKPQQC